MNDGIAGEQTAFFHAVCFQNEISNDPKVWTSSFE